MSEVKMIAIDRLHEHPNNPRREIGDVTELAESIKANGVLQYLTVVPYYSPTKYRVIDGLYTILIGHRRYNAAKLAGLSELPCVVVDMDEKTQIATMLTENMQRSDLTLYEEAKGFQMMLDLGWSVSDVAEKSGFSESTVRNRVKLARLPEKDFKKAVERGATLFDFMELDKIEDEKEREEVLATLGTKDFKNRLANALSVQKNRKIVAKWEEQVKIFAVKLDEISGWKDGHRVALAGGKEVELEYVRNWTVYGKPGEELVKPEDDGKEQYYYTRSDSEIDLFRKHRRDAEAERKAAEAKERRDKAEAKKNQLTEISERHRQLRLEFIQGFNAYQKKDANVWELVTEAMIYAWGHGGGYYNAVDSKRKLGEMLGVTVEEGPTRLNYREFLSAKLEHPERTALITALWILDRGDYWTSAWDAGTQTYRCVPAKNDTLDMLYSLLHHLGYRQSYEEDQMRDGTHELFDKGGDEV